MNVYVTVETAAPTVQSPQPTYEAARTAAIRKAGLAMPAGCMRMEFVKCQRYSLDTDSLGGLVERRVFRFVAR